MLSANRNDHGPRAGTPHPLPEASAVWHILVADRDESLHDLVREALETLQLDGRTLKIVTARTGGEVDAALATGNPFSVILIDTDLDGWESGLRRIERLRAGNNPTFRTLLLTDTADRLPERTAIEDHRADACLPKDSLTEDKLVAALIRTLRIHSTLEAQAESRHAMSKVMIATSRLFDLPTLQHFYLNCIAQLIGLLDLGSDGLLCVRGDQIPADDMIRIRAGTGRFQTLRNADLTALEDADARRTIERCAEQGGTIQTPRFLVAALRSRSDAVAVALIEGSRPLRESERQMLAIFTDKAGIALRTLLLVKELNAAQKATVLALARVAEHKDNVAPGHLQRIERLSAETARELYRRGAFPDEIDGSFLERIGMASILHDVGMICVPDKVVYSTEQLLADDFKTIRQHPKVGWEILRDAATPLRGQSVLSLAAEIARSHHERFAGGGYPYGISANAIPVAGRIVSVVDVFDALITDRSHRRAWTVEEARRWIDQQAGIHFDPQVVEAFQAVIDRILDVEPDWLPGPEQAA